MARIAFFTVYFLSPAIPIVAYLRYLGSGLSAYSLSIALGIAAFVIACNQFILASRPLFALKALGLKGLQSFHGAMPWFMLVAALAHRVLKAQLGFPLDGTQALIGLVSWLVFAVAATLGFLFLANVNIPFKSGLRRLRSVAEVKFGMSYKVARFMHGLSALAGLAIMAHVLLASSSSFASNAFGTAWLVGWLVLSLCMYALYRIRGRKLPAASG